MLKDTTIIPFRQPDAIDDPLTEVAREGARRMLAQVLIAEADAFVALWKDSKLPDGRDRVVRHGHGPQRAIQTGVGPVEVRRATGVTSALRTDRGPRHHPMVLAPSACARSAQWADPVP
jgi:hypothetical protein